MASKYCQHGLYTYSATPTWNVAQDGDGEASGAATPAVVSIDLSAASAVAGNTISILGATLTCVASGATNNQFNAGSGATLVSNLVTAINRTTNTVTLTAQGTGWKTPKIQDAVYARVGTPTTTLEIMTRAGSATYNSGIVAQSGFTGVTGPWNFSGGVSGAWGWFVNDRTVDALWPSAQAVYTYGAGLDNYLAGAQNLGDVCHLRANNVIIYSNVGVVTTLYIKSNANFLVDDGTVWIGDTGYFKFLHNITSGTYAFNLGFNRPSFTGAMYFGCKDKSRLIFENTSTITNDLNTFTIGYFGIDRNRFILDGFTANDYTNKILIGIGNNKLGVSAVFRNFIFNILRNAAYNMFKHHHFNLWQRCLFENAVVNINSYVGAPFSLYDSAPSAYGPVESTLRNIKINCAVIPSTIAVSLTRPDTYVHFENIEGASIENLTGIFGGAVFFGNNNAGIGSEAPVGRVVHQNIGGNRDFRVECPYSVVEWRSAGGFPTLNAQLPNGTLWSYSILLGTLLNDREPYEVIKLTKTNNLNTNTTLTIEMLVPPSLTSALTDIDLLFDVLYTRNSDGAKVSYSNVVQKETGTAFASSTAPWTLNSYATYIAKKMVLTLPSAIASNSEVVVSVRVNRPSPTAVVERIFINPEIGIS